MILPGFSTRRKAAVPPFPYTISSTLMPSLPKKQPEMWEQSLFDTLYKVLNEGGILTTYCAKGVVRRMLQTAGFTVERLPGPPGGKREILRATKSD